ncbi:MAG: ACT domain-containing protein [Candidatus Methanomethylophilaceae archaeon]|nr:ACT domain-containing protein [Candidatus Methanomethylophilaceae archaeon]
MEKVVVTLVGMDTVGIIAKMCTYFAENGINIIDIAQTTVRGVINVIMIVDIETGKKGFDTLKEEMYKLSKDVRCIVNIVRQNELESIAEA